MKHVILGTAGHIDHGKTTLVKALTGTDTDRLPEEKARGITIDLGFAHLQLADLDVGIVDVPGHEGLIRNMLAGATGFDAVLLVVAADEGIMPQTREHMAIAELLGVRRVVVALTKADLVDAEWLDLVRTDAQHLVGAINPAAPIVAVSSVSGAGIDELRAALAAELAQAPPRTVDDVFRLPVDRVFTVRGTGTVVTGTIWSGRLGHHEAARILPREREVRVRGVQTHGAAVQMAGAGERSAFALNGVDRADVERGQSLVVGAGWRAVRVLTARVRMLGDVALKPRQRVRVHLGTAEIMGRVLLLGDDWIQLRLEEPMVARAGDRLVIRSYSPVNTVGGGVVAEIGRARKRITDTERTHLDAIVSGTDAERFSAAAALAAEDGSRVSDLPITSGLSTTEVDAVANDLPQNVARIGDVFFAATIFTDAVQRLVRRLKRFHEAHPLERGMERAELLNELPAALAAPALARAQADGKVQVQGSLVWSSKFAPGLSERQQVLRDQILETLRQGGLAPPSVAELTAQLRSNEVRPVLRLLETEGQVTAVNFDLYVETAVLTQAIRTLRAGAGPEPRTAADFKAALPVSRKYLIPLLEYLDRTGVTRRAGDLRWIETGGTPETA
jgi:selenocysteine-specific elongation factor